ncbi:hypothetical protein ACYULU_00640 [Breznakiellaceae bacterium SP9]
MEAVWANLDSQNKNREKSTAKGRSNLVYGETCMHSIEVGASLAWALAATARYSDTVVGV